MLYKPGDSTSEIYKNLSIVWVIYIKYNVNVYIMAIGNTKGSRPTKKRTSFQKTPTRNLTQNREGRPDYPFLRRSEQNAIFIHALTSRGIYITTKIEKEISSKTICDTKEEAKRKAARYAASKR